MFTPNLTYSSSISTVTFSQSDHQYPINASLLLIPNLLNRTPHQRSLSHLSASPTTPFARLGTKVSSFSKIHGYPVGLSFQIQSSTTKIGHWSRVSAKPCGLSSKSRSQVSRAASEANSGGESAASEPKTNNKTLRLGLVFGLWYFQNIVFNIYNKKVLNFFPFPWLLASFQLFVGSVWMFMLWSLKLQPRPKISKPFLIALLGPALFHTIGHISACVSFSKVAVSFTHVIKSSEPVFSVVFSSFLGNTYPFQVWLSILPIVLGCALAAITEVSFNFQGLWGALISNVGFVLRNIYSKRSLQSFKEVNGLNLYGWITIISLLYLFPVAIFVEGSQWVQGYHQAIQAIGKPSTFYIWVLLSGIFYHLYNQSSYQALDDISPLTFSVGNTMKRVVVIVSTVLVFRNPVRPMNALGSAIAIFGTFLYSQVTAASKKSGGEKEED
ncbi:xylulose 5-phosphate/phosphate translocator, chloroplastic [Carya illinoinensis]|uniref:xylulose 5-phosphate/phosphate translocator, chloroplastic n=1 Tax=Carya illinoinensis TaxID=32201 RepID=UPI001C726571|nr:xylulose 5-phosphate/phosphate translocator, chloroplastic [Carya illinoinensis]